ncbi:MAG: hypothetical protein GY946_33360 [bacterium]|nr:hypothetical protein [bacterium]
MCLPLYPTTAGYAAECLAEFCISTEELTVRNTDGEPGLQCGGPGGSEDCAASGEFPQQFSYWAPEHRFHLHFRFRNEVVGSYSTTSFVDAYESGLGERSFRHAGHVATGDFVFSSAPSFQYDDGRLSFVMEHQPRQLLMLLESAHPDCITGDLGGTCYCTYVGDVPVLTYAVDLSIEGLSLAKTLSDPLRGDLLPP